MLKKRSCVRFSDEIDRYDFEDPYSVDFSIWYNFKEQEALKKHDDRILHMMLELTAGEKELEEKLGETTRGLEVGQTAGKRRKRSWATVNAIQLKSKSDPKKIATAYAAISAPAAKNSSVKSLPAASRT